MVREFSIVQSTVVEHSGLDRNRAKKLGSLLIFFCQKRSKVFYTSDRN